jgi:hypothetical protein
MTNSMCATWICQEGSKLLQIPPSTPHVHHKLVTVCWLRELCQSQSLNHYVRYSHTTQLLQGAIQLRQDKR